MSMNSMIQAVEAIDKYIYRQLGFPKGWQKQLELFTVVVAEFYVQNTKTMKRPLYWTVDAGLHDLINARNFIVYGKARKVNQGK
jgi:hypothetical protein